MKPTYRYDPHVLLGRVFQGEPVNLYNSNPSGVLWEQWWSYEGGGFRVSGTYSKRSKPLTYEEAYGRISATVQTLRCSKDQEHE